MADSERDIASFDSLTRVDGMAEGRGLQGQSREGPEVDDRW